MLRNLQVVAVGLATCLLLSLPCFGATDKDDELNARISALEGEIEDMHLGKGAPRAYQEMRQLEEQLEKLRLKHEEETEQSRARIRELSDQEAVLQWLHKIEEKSDELSELEDKQYESILKRARELYARRQEVCSRCGANS